MKKESYMTIALNDSTTLVVNADIAKDGLQGTIAFMNTENGLKAIVPTANINYVTVEIKEA